jgi:hypothetical protein
MAIKNNTINNLVNVAIYHIESQCDVIEQDIINKESKRLKNRIVKYGYPEPQAKEAILEFNNYFAVNSN